MERIQLPLQTQHILQENQPSQQSEWRIYRVSIWNGLGHDLASYCAMAMLESKPSV